MTQIETEAPRYEPDAEATANLIAEFSRSEAFPVNRYVQIRPVTNLGGKYLKATTFGLAADMNAEAYDMTYQDGTVATQRPDPVESYEFCDYEVTRFGFSHAAAAATLRDSEWDVLTGHRRIHAQRAMTNRTIRVVAALTNEGNYLPGHVADGGDWSRGTVDRQTVKRSLHKAWRAIRAATFGMVKPSDLRIVLNPETARSFAHSEEIEVYHKVGGVVSERNRSHRIPDTLYGIEVVAEDAVRISAASGAIARQHVMPLGVVAVVARVGGLVQDIPPGYEGKEGLVPTFSALTLLMHEEMAVDRLTDKWDDVRERITDEWSAVATAPVSGFLFKNVA